MKKLFLATVISASLMACNSDDITPSVTEPTPQGVEGTIELVDLNNSKVTVNGHSYSADSIVYNNAKLTLEQLQKDMTVAIATTNKDGTQVRLNPTIVGAVTKVDHDNNTFTINGVELMFAELSDDIGVTDWVMVSSLPAADGGYTVLSVVEFDQDLFEESEIEGPVSNLNKNNQTFDIAGLVTVSYDLSDIEDGEKLADGQWVEVEGTWDNDSLTFDATSIDVENYDDLGDNSEVEGIITWVASDKSSFELNSRARFLVDNKTEFDDGNRNNLIAGQIVEVNSIKDGANRLATEIEFDELDNDDWDKFEFERDGTVSAVVRSVAGAVISFTITEGEISTSILSDAKTEYDDGLTEASFENGMIVEVDGVIINGEYVAREIELNDDEDEDDSNI